jgi:membrane protease YdiL (CAAX protease family)
MIVMGDFIANVSKGPGLLGLIIAILTVDIVPAIAEETLFRGVFLNNLTRHYGVLKALIVISVLFAFIHVNPSVIVSIFLLGLILGYVYLKTENLIYPIMLHFFYNSFATLLLRTKVVEIKGLNSGAKTVEHVPLSIFISSVILSVLFFLIICKIVERRKT